jgi:hypothetical protein
MSQISQARRALRTNQLVAPTGKAQFAALSRVRIAKGAQAVEWVRLSLPETF